ncbi:MAG: ComEC/Rec2 family competence protein [Phycisphaerales bacterium]|nr:ComEC/Rec2 family competence protein [Phycisphaerales bacterium]
MSADRDSIPQASELSPHWLAATPLLPWAVGMMVGIAIESRVPIPPTVSMIVIAASGIAALSPSIRRKVPLLLIILAGIGLGTMRHHLAFRTLPATDIAQFAAPDRRLARISGTISSQPQITRTGYAPFEPWLHTTDRTSFLVNVESIDTGDGVQMATGQVRVSISEPALTLQENQRVEVVGWLDQIAPPRNPGQYDWALHNARRQIRTSIQCNDEANARILEESTGEARSLANHFRGLLLGRGTQIGDSSTSLLDTMVLGRRSAIDERTERLFLETGCAHYLAVSGIHIAMLASIVWFPARLLGANRRSTAALLIIAVIVYVMIADARPSMLRAAVMACTLSVALLLRRQPNTINSLSVAAILLLSLDPLSLFDVGFQLSFVAVTGIVLLTPVMTKCSSVIFQMKPLPAEIDSAPEDPSELVMPERRSFVWLRSILQPVALLVFVSISAWVSTLPIVAIHFGRLTPMGWLGSILSFPAIYAVMVLSFMKLAVGFIFPVAMPLVDWPLQFATESLAGFLEFVRGHLGGPIDVTPPPTIAVCTYYGCLLTVAIASRRGWHIRNRSCAATLLLVTITAWNWPASNDRSLTITQFAVGRGTSTIIELPNGQAWVYDAGSSSPSDPGKYTILPYMHERRISRLAGIIVSHPNLDHYGGVPSIVKDKHCDAVYLNTNGVEKEGPFELLLEELKRSGQTIRPLNAGNTIDLGDDVHAEVLWPPSESAAQLSANDQSIVVRLAYQGRSVMLTGDIGYAAQHHLINNCDLQSDVLVLPHHGAIEENTAAFIQAVNPTTLVRSTFVKNEDSPALKQAAADIPIFNTADLGAIKITIRNSAISVSAFLDRIK